MKKLPKTQRLNIQFSVMLPLLVMVKLEYDQSSKIYSILTLRSIQIHLTIIGILKILSKPVALLELFSLGK